MAKKYVPSGYQIISVDVNETEDNQWYVVESEDSKILKTLLESNDGRIYKKPILLDIYDNSNGWRIQGFAVIYGGYALVKFQPSQNSDTLSYTFSIVGGELHITVINDF